MPELLLELLSEEIPARMQARAADDLRPLVTGKLNAAGLTYKDARSYVTPRRLVLVVQGLPERQPDVTEEKKGPKVGAPEQAVQGFLKANGLAEIGEAEVRETDKGRFYFAVRQVAGRPTAEVLTDIVIAAAEALPWPKSMRWGSTTGRWVRPLWSVLAMLDGAPLKGALALGDAQKDDANIYWFGNRTMGHRFLAPEPFSVTSFADYRDRLRAAKVMIDRDERRRVIAEGAAALVESQGLRLRDDQGLLEEVTGLVEWPVVLMGEIDQAYMDLPPEVLTTSMSHHQKYFSTTDGDGRLAARFVVVANMETLDKGATIVAGNERVLRARLADARFFWGQDRKRSLPSRAPELKEIVFHAKLGTLDEKADRMEALAVAIAKHVPGADGDRVRSAARLAKADLTTGMVGEFPELQGVMGRYYALADGEHPEVARAIAEHYSPLGPSDRCPSEPVSVAVALADKIDTLVGFWEIGEKPTGSKDPYALRRAGLGVIRLILENQIRVPLADVFRRGRELIDVDRLERERGLRVAKEALGPGGFVGQGHPAKLFVGRKKPGWAKEIDQRALELLEFLEDRLKVLLRDKGVRHDLIAAVFALGGEDDLVRVLERVKALERFLASDDGANLLVAYRRAANIVRIEEKKDKTRYDGAPDEGRLSAAEERELAEALQQSAATARPALQAEDFTGAMAALARLRRPVDDFFDKVTVNCEEPDLRANRLRLLSRIGATLGEVADFSRIEG
ncbi:MAG: glycine--tRNA ligase subunit beta [Kiloniellales bacterium]